MKIRVSNSLFVILVSAVLWQPVSAAADSYDPPARVARLSYSRGSVSFQPAGDSEWVDAVLNLPIITGDNLWAGENSRAEVRIGSKAIRLDHDTGISFLTITDHRIQLRLMQGSLIVHIRHLGNENLEVDTPNLAFSPQTAGEYRIDVNQEGTETAITTLQVEGEATGPWEPYSVLSGQQARFSATMDVDAGEISSTDEFADWASERDRREDDVQSANYVSREMTGYEDLDDYGEWSNVTGYGVVWVPVVVPAGWAPYRFGQWVWVQPWGWTWVDDLPWGFAPFHYGRWAWVDGHWCLVPGPLVSQPVYAPALVVFLGGPGVSWLPLAPGEVFIPQYRTSPGYVHSVNTSNTMVSLATVDKVHSRYSRGSSTPSSQITYLNQQVANAVTAVSHDAFVNGRRVARSVMNVPQKRADASGALPTVPAPVNNRIAGQGTPTRSVPPAAIFNRPTVTRRPSAAVAPPTGKTVSRKPDPGNRQPIPIADQAPTGKSFPSRNPARSHAPDLSTRTPPTSAKRKVEPQAPPSVPSRARPAAKPTPEVEPKSQ